MTRRITPPPYPRVVGLTLRRDERRVTPAPFPVHETRLPEPFALAAGTDEGVMAGIDLDVTWAPAHVANGIWTHLQAPFAAADVGVASHLVSAPGAPYSWSKSLTWPVAWIVGTKHELARLDLKTGKFVLDAQALSLASRVTVGGDGTPCVVAQNQWERSIFRKASDGWKLLGGVGVEDVGAGNDSSHVWFASQAGAVVSLSNLAKTYDLPDGRAVVRIAVAQDKDSPASVWIVADDGTVWLLAPGVTFDQDAGKPAYYPLATDVGASAGARAWVVGRTQAPTATIGLPPGAPPGSSEKVPAAGNQLWRWAREVSGFRRVKPAWGQSIDVDGDGGAWVVDDKGRVFARGLQVLSAYPHVREKGPPPLDLPPNATPLDELYYRAKENYQRQAAAGAAGVVLLERWNLLVESPNGFENLDGLKAKIKEWGTNRGFRIFLNVSPTFLGQSAVPKPYKPIFPELADLFAKFLVEQVVAIEGFHDHVAYLALGNEVDLYLGDQQGDWKAFTIFYQKVAAAVRKAAPRVRIGATTTWEYASGSTANRDRVRDLNQESDVLVFTYYPREASQGEWKASPPKTYQKTFPSLQLDFSDQDKGWPVVFQEVGYPSSTTSDSSPEQQAKFVDWVMSQWAAAGARIPFLSWWPLHDLYFNPKYEPSVPGSAFGAGNLLAGAAGLKPKTPAYQSFGEYFSSCGLVDTSATYKPAAERYQYWSRRLGAQSVPT